MTRLHKLVRRSVHSVPRPLVVELAPLQDGGAMVTVREARRRTGHSITVAALYTVLALRAANAARSVRRNRQTRGGLLGGSAR